MGKQKVKQRAAIFCMRSSLLASVDVRESQTGECKLRSEVKHNNNNYNNKGELVPVLN
jgi:hypothetical protein